MIDFVRLRKWFYLLTAVLAVGSIVALIAPACRWALIRASSPSAHRHKAQAEERHGPGNVEATGACG